MQFPSLKDTLPEGVQPLPMKKPAPTGPMDDMIDFGTLLAWGHHGIIVGYENNRKGGSVSASTVKMLRDGWDPSLLNMFEFAINPQGQLVLADGHGRMYVGNDLFAQGRLTQEDFDTLVHVKVVPWEKFLSAYKGCNAGHRHAASDYLSNNDFAMGSLIHDRVLPAVNDPAVDKAFNSTHIINLSYVLYAMNAIGSRAPAEWNFPSVYAKRKDVVPIQRMVKGTLPWNPTDGQIKEVTDAIDFYLQVRHDVLKESPNPCKAVLGSGPFFSLVLVDRLAAKPRLPAKTKTIARRILRDLTKLSEAVKGLTSSDMIRQGNMVDEIYTKLTRN